MSAQFIFTMHKVSRFYPPDREVLKDIIAVVLPGRQDRRASAPTAPGKSSLLRIMAGVDDGFTGEARLTPGFTRRPARAGAAPRRGQGRASATCMDGVGEIARRCSSATTRCWPSGPTPTPTTRSSATSRPSSRRKIEAAGAWDLERTIEIAMDALRLPAGRRRRRPRCPAASGAGWRCAGCCCRAPTCCCSTSPPTTSTPSRSPGSSASCRTTTAPSSPSPTTATSSTTWPSWILELDRGRGHPLRGQLLARGSSRSRSAWRQEEKADSARQRTLERELEWVRMAPKARQAKGKARLAAYEKLLAEAEGGRRPRPTSSRSPSRRASASATW